jgi:YD repeat-containing protein
MSATDRVDVVVDGEGQVTKKIWKDLSGQTNRTQTITWDARGRMARVVERDSVQSGYDWIAYYDGLGRKIRTITTPLTNGVAITGQPVVIDQYYDPEVEFLEVGVSVKGEVTWKAYGPDLNGVYGGMNGIGGFEAIVPGPHLYCPLIGDAQGNVLAVYDLRHGGVTYYPSRVTGY